MNYRTLILILINSILISTCMKNINGDIPDTRNIADDDIRILTQQKILFAHKSVGYNILDGLRRLIKRDNRLRSLSIHEVSPRDKIKEPGLYHINNGENGNTKTKCDGFYSYLSNQEIGKQFDIALMKFCYVDFNADSDVQIILESYNETISAVRKSHPHLKIIHVTTPLYSHAFGFKNKIKRIFYVDRSNIKRNEYNRLLRNYYVNHDPVFDLAQIQSTHLDGSRSTFSYRGIEYNALSEIYTSDGGHLNKLGQDVAAVAFIHQLIEAAKN